MNYRRATPTETAGLSYQDKVPATYSELVHAFSEPETDHDPKVLVYWGIRFDDSTIASVYLWKELSIPPDMHHWNVGGYSYQAVNCVCEVLSNLPDDIEHVLPPPPTHRHPWTKLDQALSRACAAGDSLSVQFFIRMGADVNSRSPEILGGNVPLEEAIQGRHYFVIKTLLAAGADVNARSPSGGTPLHKAAILADKQIIQLLLDKGADTHAADYCGTPADWARQVNRYSIAEFIESKRERRTAN